jgi:hypothetical protein
MDQSINYSSLPSFLLVLAIVSLILFALQYVNKTFGIGEKLMGKRTRATWSDEKGCWTYAREDQIHTITSAPRR